MKTKKTYWASCAGKIAFDSPAAAHAARRNHNVRAGKKDSISVEVYRCDNCGKLHVGHSRDYRKRVNAVKQREREMALTETVV